MKHKKREKNGRFAKEGKLKKLIKKILGLK